MSWPATIGTTSVIAALAVISAVLWLRYGETIFVGQMMSAIVGCF